MESNSKRTDVIGQVCAVAVLAVASSAVWTWVAGVTELLAIGPMHKPISPCFAVLSLIAGTALYLFKRLPTRRAVLWYTASVALLVGLIGGLISLRYVCGWDSPVETWVAHTTQRIGHYPVGYLTQQGGLMCVFIGLAFGLQILARRGHRWARWSSYVCATIIGLYGVAVLMGYAGNMAWVHGETGVNPSSLLSGFIYLILPIGLLVRESRQEDAAGLMPVSIAAGLALIIGTITALGIRHLQTREKMHIDTALQAISDWKIQGVADWRQKRLNDAQFFLSTPQVTRDVAQLLSDPTATAARTGFITGLQLIQQRGTYAAVELYDTNAVRQLSVPEQTNAVSVAMQENVRSALSTNAVLWKDFQFGTEPTGLHFEMLAPVCEAGRTLGVLVFRIDPRAYLYPFLLTWPVAGAAGEAVLSHREGEFVTVLNELRFQTNAVGQLRLPVGTTSRVPTVMAALGQRGAVTGVDYRGVPVLAFIRGVPDTDWNLVVKMDRAQVFVGLYRTAWLALGLTLGSVIFAWLAVWGIWERQRMALAERLDHMMRNVSDAILLHDDHLRILDANDRALQLYGYSLAELQALKSGAELHAPAVRGETQIQMDPLFAHGELVRETEHRRKNGTVFPVETSGRVITLTGQRYILTIVRDISVRKAQEREIQQLTRLYRTLGNINQSIVRTPSRKKLLQEVCRLAAEHGGFQLAWIGFSNPQTPLVLPAARAGAGQEFLDRVILYADDRPEGRNMIGECLKTGMPVVVNDLSAEPRMAPWRDFAEAYDLRSMAVLPIRVNHIVTGVFSVGATEAKVFLETELQLLEEIAADISFALENFIKEEQHQQANNALFESREEYRMLFDGMQEGFARCRMIYTAGRPTDFVYLEVNPAFTQLTGLKDVVGKKVTEIIPGIRQNNPDLFDTYGRVAQSGKPEQFESYLPAFKKWFLISVTCPAPDHFVAIFIDITIRKTALQEAMDTNRQLNHALNELRTAQQQLVEQERLRALSQMASGIAHDFNNALAPIVGFSDLLLEHPDQAADPDRRTRYLQLIKTSAQTSAQVVRRLREFYRRRGTGEVMLPIRLNTLLAEAIELTQPRWQQQTQAVGIHVAVQTDFGDIPVVIGNPNELRDAFTNLIFFAVDHLPQGGTITLRTARVEQSVRVEVADTGVGMTAAACARCFEPFISDGGSETETGLSLAVTHGIIRRQKGTIAVESELGIGTTFTILFPITEEDAAPVAVSAKVGDASGLAHVLLVDDEPQLRELLEEFLKIDQHVVETAGDGNEALEKFRAGKFDLVITDQAMPGINGDQLAAAIKRQSPAMPVILLTGFGAFLKAEGKKPAGVDLILSKPVSLNDLRAGLRQVRRTPPQSRA